MIGLVLSILWKALATAIVIIAVGRIAERAGPWFAAILVGFPASIGPGMVLLSLEHESVFISEAALHSLSTTTPVLGFLLAYVLLSRVGGLWLCLVGGYLVWLPVALALGRLSLSLPLVLVMLAVSFFVVGRLMPRRHPLTHEQSPTRGWRFLIVRGVAAGLVVGSVVSLAPVLGPRFAGIFVSFPVVLATAAWMLTKAGGHALAVATLSQADRGLGSFVAFCLVVHLLAGPLSGLAATLVALGASA
ncbi:MAG: hypothetical protein AAF493_18510, partial [Pseudomonadota bacterium]